MMTETFPERGWPMLLARIGAALAGMVLVAGHLALSSVPVPGWADVRHSEDGGEDSRLARVARVAATQLQREEQRSARAGDDREREGDREGDREPNGDDEDTQGGEGRESDTGDEGVAARRGGGGEGDSGGGGGGAEGD